MTIDASMCASCSHVIIPPRNICPYCGVKAGEMKAVTLSEEAEILSYTVLEMPPEGFTSPVLLALLEFEHGAVALCKGDKSEISAVKIGGRASVTQDEDGILHFSII